MKITRRFNGGKEICEKKQDFEARRSTEALRKTRRKPSSNKYQPQNLD
jgi:hypothetical protein